MRIIANATVATWLLCLPSWGDYIIPPIENGFKMITDVVDATITKYNDAEQAELKVHRRILGTNMPQRIDGVEICCPYVSLKQFGMKPGTRYVILMHGANLFEEQSFFPVRKHDKGNPELRLDSFYKKWFGFDAEWVKLDAFEKKVSSFRRE